MMVHKTSRKLVIASDSESENNSECELEKPISNIEEPTKPKLTLTKFLESIKKGRNTESIKGIRTRENKNKDVPLRRKCFNTFRVSSPCMFTETASDLQADTDSNMPSPIRNFTATSKVKKIEHLLGCKIPELQPLRKLKNEIVLDEQPLGVQKLISRLEIHSNKKRNMSTAIDNRSHVSEDSMHSTDCDTSISICKFQTTYSEDSLHTSDISSEISIPRGQTKYLRHSEYAESDNSLHKSHVSTDDFDNKSGFSDFAIYESQSQTQLHRLSLDDDSQSCILDENGLFAVKPINYTSSKPIMISDLIKTDDSQCDDEGIEKAAMLCSGTFASDVSSNSSTPNSLFELQSSINASRTSNEHHSMNESEKSLYGFANELDNSDMADDESEGENSPLRRKKKRVFVEDRDSDGRESVENDDDDEDDDDVDANLDAIRQNHLLDAEAEDTDEDAHSDNEEQAYLEKIQRNEFLDIEAELSGSDFGGSDEEENIGQDRYDSDFIDETVADDGNLAGKLHRKEVFDEDAHKLRQYKEMFFDDEDFDGRLRERRFRWTNLDEAAQFAPDSDDDIGVSVIQQDSDNEQSQVFQERAQRRQWIDSQSQHSTLEQQLSLEESNSQLYLNFSQARVSLKPKKFESTSTTEPSADVISSPPKLTFSSFSQKFKHSSFLIGNRTLSSVLTDKENSNSGISEAEARAMVFRRKTPGKENNPSLKRKSEITSCRSTFNKKMKKIVSDEGSIFAQLD